jgi:Zn-dependent peptidase ImmA (M78 family)
MTNSERQNIEDYVKSVTDKLEISYPIKLKTLIDICKLQLSGEVKFETLPSHIDGKVISSNHQGAKKFTIILNDSIQSTNRKLFTLAHEMGHLFLHTKFFHINENENEEYIDSYARGGDYTEKERQADYFAGALLMPETLYIEQVNKYAKEIEYGIKKIANHFNISIQSATIRGKWLGIFKW